MKLRIRYKSKNNVLTIDDEVSQHITLIDVYTTARELFSDSLPSLNKKDLLEGDNKLLSEFGIINGDLIHVINLDPEPDETEQQCQSSSQLSSQSSYSKSGQHGQRSTEDETFAESTSSPGTSNRLCRGEQNIIEYTSHDNEMSEMQSSNNTGDEPPIDFAVVNKYLNEPMLCRDSTEMRVPAALEQLFANSGIRNSHDALCVLLHVMMLEAGYQTVHQPPDGVTEKSHITMPDDWLRRSSACTTLKYTHTSCGDVESSFMLTCVPMCSLMVVHGTSSGPNKGEQVQLQLNTPEYIGDINQGAVKCYKQQKKLSRLFKDIIALPMLQSFQEANGMLPVHGIMALSNELKLKILGYLNVESVLTCSEVCKEFYRISRDRYIWRRLFVKEFGNRLQGEMNLSRDWYEDISNK
ncbi:hypothetical protein KUTeg_020622 [Tegillarca granosa]|uniref:F-box domain-containing protein n=1 Tax=Tegillarca granosa TaxID=220873 RepID=A0ABQ9EDX1_TEGGR|nr:hypothetical protein KUTeg_020622 [Tegillarca granosa]